MRGGWSYESSNARTSPSMTTHPSLFDQDLHHSSPQSLHRYPHTSYLATSPQHSLTSMGAVIGQAYINHFAWPTGSQSTGSDYIDSPLGTPYSENGSVDSGFYVGHTTSSSVGYPESSQRTHLTEGVLAAIYHNPRFDGGIPAMNNQVSNITSNVRDGEQVLHDGGPYHSLIGTQGSGMAARRGYGAQQTSADLEPNLERMSPQRLSGYSRDGLSPQQGIYSSLYSLSAFQQTATPQTLSNPHQTTRLTANSSPKLPSYPDPSDPNAYHSLGEPGSPSVVPPLIFDGEELDDECSLHSASSEISHSSTHSMKCSRQYGHASGNARDEWSGSAPDDSMAFEDISSPTSQDTPLDGPNSSPPPESEFSSPLPSETTSSESAKTQSKKSKMHQCNVCSKWFPRPSGLATHMNSHSGARPYKCPISTCTKSFAVRSNAKRHLRTHGIFPTTDSSTPPAQFTVGFDDPIVSDVPQVGKLPAKLRWVPQSLATRTNVDYLRDTTSDSEDEYPPTCPVLSVPLPAVVPSSPKWNPDDRYEERNSYGQVGMSPYHSSQWRALPGPAIITPSSL